MFGWFSKDSAASPGLDKMQAEFGQMLDAGRHVFDASANALLGGTDLEVIRQDLFATDKRINEAEQRIRQELVVHATVHGANSFPACLILMSVVKDAERIGDYAKNLFDLAALMPSLHAGKMKDDLISQKDNVSRLLAECREAFDRQDVDAASKLIDEAKTLEDHFDKQITEVVQGKANGGDARAAFVLAYRYFKRVTSHTKNVATSIVQPIHKIDYAD